MRNRILVLGVLVGALLLALSGMAFADHTADHTLIPDLPGMEGVVPGEGTGGVEAPAVGRLGDTDHGPCVEELLNIPALDACVDAQGRVVMDLPALKLVSPAERGVPDVAVPDVPHVHKPHAHPRRLPVTGANVGDIAALGLAALSGGGVMLRRIRLAFAS